tara:strand:- start:89 stop:877 length:789 start_codon:yes stop_codon:yes gene_type:complete
MSYHKKKQALIPDLIDKKTFNCVLSYLRIGISSCSIPPIGIIGYIETIFKYVINHNYVCNNSKCYIAGSEINRIITFTCNIHQGCGIHKFCFWNLIFKKIKLEHILNCNNKHCLKCCKIEIKHLDLTRVKNVYDRIRKMIHLKLQEDQIEINELYSHACQEVDSDAPIEHAPIDHAQGHSDDINAAKILTSMNTPSPPPPIMIEPEVSRCKKRRIDHDNLPIAECKLNKVIEITHVERIIAEKALIEVAWDVENAVNLILNK